MLLLGEIILLFYIYNSEEFLYPQFSFIIVQI